MYDAYGSIDILVNNAGVQKDSPVHKMSVEDWNLVLSVNLTGQFLCSREAANGGVRYVFHNEAGRKIGRRNLMRGFREGSRASRA